MTYAEIEDTLSTMVIIYDTREQPTPALMRRLSAFPCKTRREMCGFGDYSACCTLPDGTEYSLNGVVAIERKMSLDELSRNFTVGRERFAREFGRAKDNGGKLYLLVENANWDMIFAGRYKTKFNKDAYVASLMAWQARYGTQVLFCTSEISQMVIYKVLRYELKERLERMCEE